MKTEQVRKLVSQAVIVGAVCVGAPALVVAPLKTRLAKMETALASAHREAARAVEDQHRAQIRPDDVNRARDRARRLAEMSRTSSDAAAIYERVMTLGARHGVRIDRMEPARVAARRAAARPAGAAPVAQTIGFTVSLIADYEALGAFIDAVERDTGFSSVESIRLTPLVSDGAELVQAVLETRHRGFPGVSSALASAKEQSP